MKTASTLLTLAALGSLATGCYRTRFDLAPPQPEQPSAMFSDHFHFSVIGIIEVSRPLDLQASCNGAAPTAAEEQINILGAIVNAVVRYFGISVHNATIYCPYGGGVQPIYPTGGPYPPPGQQPYPPAGQQPYPPQPGTQPYPPQPQQ